MATKKKTIKNAVAVKKAAPKKAVVKKIVSKKGVAKVKKALPKVAKKVAVKAAPVKAEPVKFVPVPPKKPVLLSPKNIATKQYSQAELFEAIRSHCGFANRSQAKEFYGNFTSMLQSALKNGYVLSLPGLGKLYVRKTSARKGINPQTHEPIMISAKRKIAFTALKALKEAVL